MTTLADVCTCGAPLSMLHPDHVCFTQPLVSRLQHLLGPDATIADTPMVTFHRDTLREIVDELWQRRAAPLGCDAKGTVIQTDRDAAADFYAANPALGSNAAWRKRLRDGEIDDSKLVQAFARHRLAAINEARGAETGWLVERDTKEGLFYASATRWEPDHQNALRFAREQDARAFAEANKAPCQAGFCGWCNYTRIAEHRWG